MPQQPPLPTPRNPVAAAPGDSGSAVATTLTQQRPWLRHYGAVPAQLHYPDATLYQMIAASAARAPTAIAWDFFDTRASYRTLLAQIDRCADALASLGLGARQRLLIVMPTTPQGVIAFYAANKLGAVAALIHPLSTSAEIGQALDATTLSRRSRAS